MRTIILASVLALGACASTQPPAAFDTARVHGCPKDRVQTGARSEGFGPTSGLSASDVTLVPLAHDATRVIRLRRLVVQPGGVIAWHDHKAIQGFAVVQSGEMVELRGDCLDPIPYRAGDVAREDADTVHGWRNEGRVEAVILVSHVVAR